MMEKIDEKTIAIQTHLSINLLGRLAQELRSSTNKSITDFIKEWEKSINWDKNENYSIFNQGVILTHLYGLIVYPKQIFHGNIPNIKLDKINKEEWGGYIFLSLPLHLNNNDKRVLGVDVISNENELTLEFLIRKIRNSISHARVTIYEDMSIEFNDKDDTKILFSISGLQRFTGKFKDCYINKKCDQ